MLLESQKLGVHHKLMCSLNVIVNRLQLLDISAFSNCNWWGALCVEVTLNGGNEKRHFENSHINRVTSNEKGQASSV